MSLSLARRETLQLRRALLRWYDAHHRDLPWRRDVDPYRVWVSEIMLQQTRVAAVLKHYARFMRRFPTVQALASAREESVLAIWSGLGYYHRARRLHQAAKLIVRECNGEFPRTAEGWRELPGIGATPPQPSPASLSENPSQSSMATSSACSSVCWVAPRAGKERGSKPKRYLIADVRATLTRP